MEKSEKIQQNAMVSESHRTPQVTEGEEYSRITSQGIESHNAEKDSGYVASKNGTKYHLPWCGSAKQIKEENKIWFATKEEAEKAGYTPASNCKGI